MRKDIREGVKKHMIDGIKPNYAALAKQYGCDYRTVKAAYHEALEGGKRPVQRKKRPSNVVRIVFLNLLRRKVLMGVTV